eukprot:symbB.v1.2.021415.t1/scaffold1848.1/size98926/4
MKRPAAASAGPLVKKAKRVGTTLPFTKGPLPLTAMVRRTDVTSAAEYMDKRSDQCDGLTVKECLELQFKNKEGEKVSYKQSDLRYDLQAKRLELQVPEAPSSKSSSLVKVKHPSAAADLSNGVNLHNGVVMPVVGFGTYKLSNADVTKPVLNALKLGYRLIDTAQVYENEKGVGEALRQSGIAREDVFIETKVWRSSHGYERTMKACKQSLKKLGVEYLDLYVIHWPGPKTGWPLKRGQVCPSDWTPKMRDTGTWRAMEELYEQGLVKAIGVTNYSLRHLKQIMKNCKIKPMINQVEFHPRLVQTEMLEFCQKNDIVLQAYASLGSGDAAQAEDFFSFPAVQKAAVAHKATGAQVLLRWAMQKGCHVIPKSVRPERMKENAGVFNFKLTAAEMKSIDALHTGTRYAWKGHSSFTSCSVCWCSPMPHQLLCEVSAICPQPSHEAAGNHVATYSAATPILFGASPPASLSRCSSSFLTHSVFANHAVNPPHSRGLCRGTSFLEVPPDRRVPNVRIHCQEDQIRDNLDNSKVRSMGSCTSNISQEDYRHPQHFPMWVLKVSNLLQMTKMHSHQKLRAANLLVEHRSSFFTIFVSHQWMSRTHPDPSGQQFRVLQQALQNIIDGRIEIQSSLVNQLCGDARRIRASERKALKNGYVWIDWFSVPQITGVIGKIEDTLRCVKSIPFYVEASKVFITLAPTLRNMKGEVCNYNTYLTRGTRCGATSWQIHVVKFLWFPSLEKSELNFPTPRQVIQILRIALDGRIAMLKNTNEINHQRYLLGHYEKYLGLPAPQRTSDDFLMHFHFSSLRDAVSSNRCVAGLACATMSGDIAMMRYLVNAKASVNAAVPQMMNFDVLQHSRVLHLAATGARDEGPLLELLQFRADPNIFGPFGASPLGFATSAKTVQLLLRFRAQVNFAKKLGRISPLGAACSRSAPTEVIQELLKHQADVNLRTGGLGFTPMLALALFASRNPNTFEHFDLLLNAKGDVNQPGEPTGIFRGLAIFYHGYLKVRKLPWQAPVRLQYLAGNLGSTPLHLACLAGSSDVAEYLINHAADLHRKNDHGLSPLDLALETPMREMLESHIDVISI